MSHRWMVNNKHQAKMFCDYVMENVDKHLTFEIHEPKLTSQQNKAVFAYCDDVARHMDAAGIDMQHALSGAKLSIPPTGKMLYETMWKPIQTAMLSKTSLTKVGVYEIDQIYQVMARHLAERHDIQVRFGR